MTDNKKKSAGKKSMATALTASAVLGAVTPNPANASDPRPPLPDMTGLLRGRGDDYATQVASTVHPHEFPSTATINKLKQGLPSDTVDDILALYDKGDEGFLPTGDRVLVGSQLSRQLAHLTHLVQHLILILEQTAVEPVSDESILSTLETSVNHFTQSLTHESVEDEIIPSNDTDESDVSETDETSETNESVDNETHDTTDVETEAETDTHTADDTDTEPDNADDAVLRSIIADETASITTTASVTLDSQIGLDAIATAIDMTPNSIILSTARSLGAQSGDPALEKLMMDGAHFIIRSKPHAVNMIRNLPTVQLTTTTESLTASVLSIGRALVNNGTTPVTKPDVLIGVNGRNPRTPPAVKQSTPKPKTQPEKQSHQKILPDLITPVGTNDRINLAISRAKSKLGTPYAWGGGKPGIGFNGKPEYYPSVAVDGSGAVGYDCSGLVVHAFYQVLRNDRTVSRTGDPEQDYIRMPRWSGDQYMRGGKHVPLDSAQPGDLLFWGTNGSQHVAIYLGNGRMIEAKDSQSGIIESPVRYSGIMPFAVRVIY